MKIILLQDVKSVGKKDQIIEANDGYARNFLIPKKLGVEANGKNLNDLKLKQAKQEKLEQERLEEAQALAEKLKGQKVVVKMKAGENGKAFGSVSSKEIAAEAKKQCGLELDKKKIQLAEPIRNFGSTEVTIKLHPKVGGTLLVQVVEG